MLRPVEEQWEVLRRGVEQVVPESEFREKLERSVANGQPLRVKYGIDPTGIDVHLGHTVPLRKLRQFQDLGHKAVIIIGNYTALVGDPSGRDEARAALTEEQVEANARDYLAQVAKVIDLDRAEVHHNGDWFGKWSFLQVLDLCRRMTIGQITAREDFASRMAAAKPVYLHECLYPLMQGWDSVEIRADVELGGTEQLFSLLVARELQEEQGQSPQVAMTLPILVGTDGSQRMGKSLGNYIGVGEPPDSQFGKVMSVPDEPLRQYFTLLTDLPAAEIDRLLAPDINPRDAKEALGKTIVSQYHGPEAADRASENFRRRARGEDPLELPVVEIPISELGEDHSKPLARLIVDHLRFESSTSNARRVIQQGGVTIGKKRLNVRSPNALVVVRPDDRSIQIDVDGQLNEVDWEDFIIRHGKRKIARVRFTS